MFNGGRQEHRNRLNYIASHIETVMRDFYGNLNYEGDSPEIDLYVGSREEYAIKSLPFSDPSISIGPNRETMFLGCRVIGVKQDSHLFARLKNEKTMRGNYVGS